MFCHLLTLHFPLSFAREQMNLTEESEAIRHSESTIVGPTGMLINGELALRARRMILDILIRETAKTKIIFYTTCIT